MIKINKFPPCPNCGKKGCLYHPKHAFSKTINNHVVRCKCCGVQYRVNYETDV